MRARVLVPLAFSTVALLGCLAAGCSDTSAPRSIVRVTAINENLPLQSDVVGGTEEAPTVKEDAISMSVNNVPHDATLTLTANGQFGYVVLDRYEIRFVSQEPIEPVTGALGWTVPTGQTVSGSIIVVPASLKVVPPLVVLRQGGEFQTTAKLTIIGHEADSWRAVRVCASFPVNFANWTN
jgi:hypothetical protein